MTTLHPKAIEGLNTLMIQAGWMDDVLGLPSLTVLYAPPGPHTVPHTTVNHKDIKRFDYRRDAQLGSNAELRTRCWGHAHENEASLHFVCTIENTRDVFTDTSHGPIGFFVYAPGAYLEVHDVGAHDLRLTWLKETLRIDLPIDSLGRGQDRGISFSAHYGKALSSPVRVYRTPTIDTPPANPPAAYVNARNGQHRDEYQALSTGPRPGPWESYGMDKAPGSAGEQERFGWNPDLFCGTEDLTNPRAVETMRWLRMKLLRVELSRPTWWEHLARGVPAVEANSEYNFGQGGCGLHWSSRRLHGHRNVGNALQPNPVPEGGYGGWNGEHFVSLLFEYAWATRDPWAMDFARDLGYLAGNILCDGVYYGGIYDGSAVSIRYFARCIRAILMAGSLFPENPDFYRMARDRAALVLRHWKPLKYSHAPGASDHVQGDQRVIDCWQLGLIAAVRTWFAEVPDLAEIHDDWGRIWLASWHDLEEPILARFPKFCLADDPAVGVDYAHRLDIWSYGFCKSLKGRPGIDETKRAAAQQSIELRWPELAVGASKWACGDWPEEL